MYIDCITFPQKKALQISKVLRTSPLYPGLRRVRPPRTTPQDGPWSLDLYPAAGPQSLKSQGVVISHWETGHQRCFVDTLFSTMKKKNIWVHKLPSFYDAKLYVKPTHDNLVSYELFCETVGNLVKHGKNSNICSCFFIWQCNMLLFNLFTYNLCCSNLKFQKPLPRTYDHGLS